MSEKTLEQLFAERELLMQQSSQNQLSIFAVLIFAFLVFFMVAIGFMI